MKVKIVGKEIRNVADKKTSEVKTYRTLHVEYCPLAAPDGVEGHQVDTISVKFDMSDIKIGAYYNMDLVKNVYNGRRYTILDSYSEIK